MNLMKTSLLIFFLSFSVLAYGSKDRELINQIDSISSSSLILYKNNQIIDAFNGFNEVKRISDSIQDHYGKAISNFHLGNIYSLMHENENAESSYISMLESSIKLKDNYLIAQSYLNLGRLNKKHENTKKVVVFLKKALLYISKYKASDYDNFSVNQHEDLYVKIRIGLSEFYIENNNLDEALKHILRTEEVINTDAYYNTYLKSYSNFVYGEYYVKKQLNHSANKKFNKAADLMNSEELLKYNNFLLLSKIYKSLSKSYSAIGNKEKAYDALLQYDIFNKKLLNKERVKETAINKSKFLLADYKNEARLANREQLHQAEIAGEIRKINIIIITTLILLTISLVVLCRYYILKRRLSKALEKQNSELILAKNEALKSSELKSKFISNVTHELRTPLYGVVGLTSLLLNNNGLTKRDGRHLRALKYSGDYLLNLVNDILQVGKMEAEKIELKNVSVNLRSVMESIVGSFDYRLQETNNKIELLVDDDVPKYLKFDEVRLSQVLINLIGNSVKFTKSGLIFLRIKLLDTDSKVANLRFEVEDNGIGIANEKLDTIFDNFSQLEEESNVNYQGTGLGLSITKNLIELFDSKVEVESVLHEGSTFSFNVFFAIDDKIKSKSIINHTKTLSKNKKYNILVAEDNKINQIVTENLLKKEGYSCTIAINGKKALEALHLKHYDLILMDINMPVMNGNDATKAIRKFNTIIPIVALTASSIEDLKEDYRTIGYNDIITKPFDNYEFFQTISTEIENSNGKDFKLVIAS